MEDRPCAHCGELFRVNRRAQSTHSYCSKSECQRERRRVGQLARRARDGRPPLSDAGKAHHTVYMRSYRRRGSASEAEACEESVREAGFAGEPASVFVVRGPGPSIRLRVVTSSGADVVVDAIQATETRRGEREGSQVNCLPDKGLTA